ncbi:MAG TPA: hypothetical protein VF765_12365 [Polyangiaceae bacterium]
MSALDRIIATCMDDVQTLDRGDRLDPRRRAALARIAQTRRVFCDALCTAGRTLHVTPRAQGSWLGALRRLWLDLRVLAGGPHAGDVVIACRRSRDRLEARVTWGLTRGWTKEIEQILVEERSRIALDRDVLLGLTY